MRPQKGFTLIEVMVAVAIAGLTIAGGFKLITVSLRALADVKLERELVGEARKVYLEYLAREDMPDQGEKDGVTWETEAESVPAFGTMALSFRRLTVEYRGKTAVLYLPDNRAAAD